MQDVLDTYFKAIGDTQIFLNQVHRLSAIWRCDNPTWLVEDGVHKRTVRFTDHQLLKVVDGKITDCKEGDEPNYKIVSCHGAERHSFSLVLEDLETRELITLKL